MVPGFLQGAAVAKIPSVMAIHDLLHFIPEMHTFTLFHRVGNDGLSVRYGSLMI